MTNHFHGYLYVVKTKNSTAKEGAVLFGKGVEKKYNPCFYSHLSSLGLFFYRH